MACRNLQSRWDLKQHAEQFALNLGILKIVETMLRSKQKIN